MDPDHTKQPSRYPSSNQRRHHRPVTTANNAEGFVTIVSKSPPSRRELSAKGSNVVINNLLESSKGSLDERKSDDLVTTSNFMNSSSGGSTSHSHIHTDGSNKGRLERPRQREVGKVKPIRIIPPQNLNEEEGKEKVLAILKSSSAWEGSVDNQRDGDHEDDGFEVQQEEFKESMETPEKMFISASEMGHKKYYLDRATAEEGKDQKPKVLLLQEGEISKEDKLGSNKGESETGDESMKKGKGKQEEDLVGSQSTMSISSESLILKPSSMNLFSMSSSSSSERVKVIVRCRPMSKKELGQGHECVVTVNRESGEIEVKRPQSTTSTHSLYNNSGNIPDVKLFSFDSVYDQRIPQKQLYDDAFRPLVDSVLEGYNGTIFAYGQTGTGKTYTMEGIRANDEEHGVIPNAFKHVFSHVVGNPNRQYLIRASYLEIYQEEIRDLLSKDRKQHRELKESPTSGVYVKDLSTYLCSNFSEINELMTRGNKNRAVGATNMNEHSSRSHAIFQITIEVSEQWPDGQNHFKVGKLNLVDLAGSERQGKTGAVGERLKEATKINLSLSALGNVIAALVDGKSTHIPYRDSKLTRLLQDSLGGNSHTIMVATVGPASFNWEETITTLRYASRAKKIKNKPKVNEDPKDAMLRQYQEEISRLRVELDRRKAKQAEMLQRSQQESSTGRSHTGRSRSSRAHTASSTASDSSSSASDQLRQIEEQRLKELASLLAPYGVDPSADPQDIMNQLDERRKELLNDSQTVKEERDKLLKRLDETQSLVRNTAEECKKLAEKIQWLESKVLTGGKSLVDHTNEQQKLIQAKQQELAEQTERYEDMRRKLQENELTTTELRSNAESLEAELHTKTKKLKKLSQKLYFTKEEVESLNDEHVNTMKELENVLLELKKEFSLKRLIIDNFIPYPSRKMIEGRIVWDKQMEEYKLASLNSNYVLERPPINRMTKTPLFSLSETGTVHMVDNVHYLDENILQLHPELPKRRTKDYVPPSRDPYITSLIKRAVEDAEKEAFIDCRNLSKKRTKTAKIPQKNLDYFKMGDNLVCRRVKSAKPVARGSGLLHVQFRDFVVVSNFHKHFSPPNFGHSSVLRGSGYSDY